MITVRKATELDLPWMLGQAEQFLEYHPLDIKYKAGHIAQLLLDMLENGIVLIATENGDRLGAVGGYAAPNIFDPDYIVLSELFLWVDKRHRKSRAMHHLVKAFTEKGKKYSTVTMCHTRLTPSLGRVFEKRYGMTLMETTYTKEVF